MSGFQLVAIRRSGFAEHIGLSSAQQAFETVRLTVFCLDGFYCFSIRKSTGQAEFCAAADGLAVRVGLLDEDFILRVFQDDGFIVIIKRRVSRAVFKGYLARVIHYKIDGFSHLIAFGRGGFCQGVGFICNQLDRQRFCNICWCDFNLSYRFIGKGSGHFEYRTF
ncbi:hypothetical protein SDC9_141402 [bioreactor metagenome]|uniref:Uncharacterized protein n=1 Tax=bioreactor metagenome TaxID=1076179 RepID=A0A645DY39_9ZZZZ